MHDREVNDRVGFGPLLCQHHLLSLKRNNTLVKTYFISQILLQMQLLDRPISETDPGIHFNLDRISLFYLVLSIDHDTIKVAFL